MECVCTQAGFCERRGCSIPGLHFRRCQAGQGEAIDTLYANRQRPPEPNKIGPGLVHRSDLKIEGKVTEKKSRRDAVGPAREKVGTALTTIISGFLKVKPIGTCSCGKLATQMDGWGIAGCEQRREEIITALVSNREMLEQGLKANGETWKAKATRYAPDSILKVGAGWLLDLAIERSRQLIVKESKRGDLEIVPLTMSQRALRDAAQSAKPPAPDQFTDTPVLHFGAHLWPVRGNWEWHAARWNEIAETINGRCIVGVVMDNSTATLEEVQDKLSSRFELFTAPNTPQGENPTFRKLQEMIPSGQNDVLLYCHGKGVRAHTFASESVRIWTEMMYETVMHNTMRVIEKLDAGYKSFGSFRSFGNMPISPTNRWHYSGTFFAIRAKHLPGKTVKSGYGGVEAWCGDHVIAAEAWNEFYDSPGFKFGYDLKAMYPDVVNAQMQWEVDRIGGPRCEQHLRELEWFINFLKPTDRMLIIGSKHGGLEAAIKRRLPDVTTVAIDIAPQVDNTQEVIVGSSADPQVQAEAIRRGPYDIVFIDGDHGYAGVAEDWSFADQVLNPRLIAFHDIAEAIKHRKEGCEVDRLWREIKSTHDTDEKIVGCGWGGIGIVKAPS
jgi:hypothetical protein